MMQLMTQRLWVTAHGSIVCGSLHIQEPPIDPGLTVLGLDFKFDNGRWDVRLAQVKAPIDYEPGVRERAEPPQQLPTDPDRGAVKLLRDDLKWAKDMRVQIGPHAAQLLVKVCDIYLDEE